MKIALASDEAAALPLALVQRLRDDGHEVVPFGALRDERDDDWAAGSRAAALAVANGSCARGIVCCWTGTGASIAANKVPGVRAALCGDAETAAGARRWNDANVLALSLRATAIPVAFEIVVAFLTEEPTDDPKFRAMFQALP